jgi:hypothetical protein
MDAPFPYDLHMRALIIAIYTAGGFLFLGSVILYIYTRVRLYPRNDPDLENCYYEFEESHPAYARYLKWSRISMVGATMGALLLFLGMVF